MGGEDGMRQKKIRLYIFETCLWLISLVVLLPLLLILVNALKTPAETNVLTLNLPQKWQFVNFIEVFRETNIIHSFFNSLLVTVLSIGLPVQIIALVQVLQVVHMMDNYAGLILVYTAMFIPQSVFMVYGFVSTIPKDMDEAAIMDGASPWNLFIKIMMPLLKPIIVTLFITQFVFVWNDFQMPLYLIKSSKNWTIVLGVYNFMGQYNSQWNMVCAYILLCTLPVVIVYLMGQKYIIDGMVAGAVKG